MDLPQVAIEKTERPPTAEQVAQWMLAKQLQITGYARMIVKDMHLAEDIFQEVCVAAIKSCEKFDSPEGTVRWAMTVARNRSLDHLRRRKNQAHTFSPELLDLLSEEWAHPAGEQAGKHPSEATFEQLEECLDKLTPRSRKLLRLRYGGDKKPADIALLMNRKVEAIYKAITRANEAMRSCMKNAVQPGR